MRLKRASLLTKLVIMVLLVYLATSLLDLWDRSSLPKSQRDGEPVQVEDQRLANQELREAIETTAMTLTRWSGSPGSGAMSSRGETLYIDVGGLMTPDVRAPVRVRQADARLQGKFTRRIF